MIRKVGKHYVLYSLTKDPKTGKRRALGYHKTRLSAVKQERAIQASKHAR